MKKLKALFKEMNPDVVHTHQVGALFYAGSASRKAGVPVVVHTEHGKHYSGRLRTRILGRWAGRSTAKIFCVSGDIAKEVLKYRIASTGKVTVVHNGIDVDLFETSADDELRASLGIRPNARIIGTIGRLSEVKSQEVLLRAFAIVMPFVPGAQLLLVGDGPKRAELERLADELGIKDATYFVGYQSQPEKFFPLLDAFAITSRSEGMPLSVLEAWAAGVPVLASAVGGLPEMIDHGKTGLLFPAGDHEALAQMLRELLNEPRKAQTLRSQGRIRVRNSFSLERMANHYQEHYLELLSLADGRKQ